ncbi:MAG: NADP oxidoreductase, partial [Gemmatimonadetes bacterium]|nr:NADP oxidoreductase [Gemmatimonadota bacterium]
EFVAWYNGHPDYVNHSFDLSHEVAIVIGQGNVAVDVCRILCKTVDELKHTDIAGYALEALAESKVKEIHMVGRRGPVQAAFTPQEMKEFGELQDCDPRIDAGDLELGPVDQAERDETKNGRARKNLGVLEDLASRAESSKSRRFVVHFLSSPQEIRGGSRIESVVFERNRLEGEPGSQRARGTGDTFEMDCGIFFRSVGYRGVPIEGVPFNDDRGVFPNDEGRITDAGVPVPGLYAVGWIKRGPSGIIGTNKPDAAETVAGMLDEVQGGGALVPEQPEPEAMIELLESRQVRYVTFEDWRKLDEVETMEGEKQGRPRVKVVRVERMLEIMGR